jgi:S1-C subfamily serine protease
VYPPPARIGVRLDPGDQAKIVAVEAGTPAAHAGLQAGDRLLRLGAQARVATLGDVQWALHVAPAEATELAVTWQRSEGHEQEPRRGTVALPVGWKRGTPEEYAWRPYKWNLSPGPGFGGVLLSPERKQALGLAEDAFALRIDYLVTWGERAHRGRAARAAGLREGDVVVGFAGRSDFATHDLFQAWVRLTRTIGESVEVVVWRRGTRVTLRLELTE